MSVQSIKAVFGILAAVLWLISAGLWAFSVPDARPPLALFFDPSSIT
jgi:hypothetical protein